MRLCKRMYRQRYIRDFFSFYIEDEKELDDFGLWAFGDKVFEMSKAIMFLECWNMLHGDCLKLEEEGLIADDALKMVKLWRDSLA